MLCLTFIWKQTKILSMIPIMILKQLVQGNPSLALCKNLDKLTKEDIIEIIKDKNLIELLEQLDENEKKH